MAFLITSVVASLTHLVDSMYISSLYCFPIGFNWKFLATKSISVVSAALYLLSSVVFLLLDAKVFFKIKSQGEKVHSTLEKQRISAPKLVATLTFSFLAFWIPSSLLLVIPTLDASFYIVASILLTQANVHSFLLSLKEIKNKASEGINKLTSKLGINMGGNT